MGFNITHVYGLTETYGPASVCAKHPEWDKLPIDLRAARNGRQGVRYHMQEAITVTGYRRAWSRCPGMAKPWARSCSVAIWS
jgi:hypothetical protein